MGEKLSTKTAHDLVVQTLVRCRTTEANAAHVADALIAAEKAGQIGHGLRRVPSYAAQALSGKVDGFAVPEAKATRTGALSVNAANGFAYPALALAMDWLPEAAKSHGIAVAGIHRSHHAGVTGWFVSRLADANLVGMMFANTPAAMAPWGGARPLFGTNPVAFAAPISDAPPMVIDLSLSTVARGKIMAAAQKGEQIPEDWATDVDGNPTTDPTLALKGMMQPIGGAKGAALALMVEVLAASVTGANTASEASDFFGADGPPPGTGQLIIALDPTALGGVDGISRLAEMFIDNGDARVPGHRRNTIAKDVDANGITLDADLKAQIDALGR